MSTYSEAAALKSQLTALINEAISNHPIVKRTLKAQNCIIVSEPNRQTHTIKVRLSPFDTTVIELPYAPKIPLAQLKPNTVASVWYFYTINNGIVMQNKGWTAYGQDDLENLANGKLNLLESIQILAEYLQQLDSTVAQIETTIESLNTQVQDLAKSLQQTNTTIETQSKSIEALNTQVQNLEERVTALENKSN